MPKQFGMNKKNTWMIVQVLEFLGWLVGIEPTYVRVTVVSVNRFTIATM